MIVFAEILIIIALPLCALLLRGQSLLLTALVMGSLGIALLVLLSVGHHGERRKLTLGKFSEYAILMLIAITAYLFLV